MRECIVRLVEPLFFREYAPRTKIFSLIDLFVVCRIYSNVVLIQIEPKAVEVSEKGGDQNVTVTSTIPIVCDYNTNRSCCLYLALDADGPKSQ